MLSYPRIQRRHGMTTVEIGSLVRRFQRRGIVVVPTETLSVVQRDESDNRFLECAVAGSADYLVSGDDDLLSLGSYERVQIVRAADFLAMLGECA